MKLKVALYGFTSTLFFYFSRKRSYYSKIKCQRIEWARWGSHIPYRYIETSIFDSKLTSAQQMTLIKDIFDNKKPCLFGDNHGEQGYASFFELARILVSTQRDRLSPETLGILLVWLTNEYPNALVGVVDKFAHLYYVRSTAADKISHLLEDRQASRMIRILTHFPNTPRKVVFESFLGIIDRIDATISPDDLRLDQEHIGYLKDYLLSMNRTHQEISVVAYKPYDWIKPILFKSPKITEEDKVVSALVSRGNDSI